MLTAPPLSILQKNASKLFWGFVVLHFLCWTIIPTFCQPNAPLDVVEGFVWGNEMQWGYYKHPPLQAWLLQLSAQIFGNSGFGYFGLSALTVSISLWAIYRTGRLFTTKVKALIATLLCEGILYFNSLSTEFNPNVLQLMTWALCGYAFANAILRDKLKYWILLGMCFALGCYAKYSIILLGLGFALFVLSQKEVRGVFLTYKPYVAFVVFGALLSPHIMWLFDNHFLPFSYALSRSEAAKTFSEQLFFPVKFTLSQLLDMMPMLALASMLLTVQSHASHQSNLRNRLLQLLAFAPLVLNFVISLITGHKALDMWGMPYLSFIPLWLVVNAPLDYSEKKLRGFAIAWVCLFVLPLAAFYVNLTTSSSYGFKPLRGNFSGAELSRLIHEKWGAEVASIPLTYIISDSWLGGNIALYAPNVQHRPHVFIDGEASISPWINQMELENNGAVAVWRDKQPKPAYLANYNGPIQSAELPWRTVTKMPPTRIFWVFIKPKYHDN